MGGTQSSSNNQSRGPPNEAIHFVSEVKTCYYEILGLDRLASHEE
jgi:hypothetical protein